METNDLLFDNVLTDKEIRQFLVELSKQRAIVLLNMASDENIDHKHFTMVGTSPEQIQVVRKWLTHVAYPLFFETMRKIVDETSEVEKLAKKVKK